MSAIEMIGFFYVILTCALGSVLLLMLAGLGFYQLKQDWDKGIGWSEIEEEIREHIDGGRR